MRMFISLHATVGEAAVCAPLFLFKENVKMLELYSLPFL